MKSNFKVILFYAIIIGLAIFTVVAIFGIPKGEEPKYDDILEYFEKDAVINFHVDADNNLTMEVVDISKPENLDENGKAIYVKDTTKLIKITYGLRSLDMFYQDTKEYRLGENKNVNLEKQEFEKIQTLPV